MVQSKVLLMGPQKESEKGALKELQKAQHWARRMEH